MWHNVNLLNRLSKLFLVMALVLLVTAAILWATRHPRFAIDQVRVVGELKEVDVDYLRRIARGELRGNFFTLNLNTTREAFARVPWVKDVAVRRRWPKAIEVHIIEHKPLAVWNERALVSTQGIIFQADSSYALPTFQGPEGSASDMVERLASANQSLQALGLTVRELRLSERLAWSMRLSNDQTLMLGRDDWQERLQRFVAHYRRASQMVSRAPQAFDMRYRKAFVVALSEPAQGALTP